MANSIQQSLINAFNNVFASIYDFIPSLIAAILVFIIGVLIANWCKKIIIKIFRTINLGKAVQNKALDCFLKEADIKKSIEAILGGIVKWLLVLIFAMASANILGLSTISNVLNRILGYIPNIFSAIFVLFVGIILAGFVEKLVKGLVGQLDRKTGRLFAKIASYLMMVFASLAAFNELGIAKELINILFVGLVSTLSLAFGLAFGLGAKDIVAQFLNEWYQKLKKELKDKQ